MLERDPEYIGDGVYASHDGHNIWLKTKRDGRDHSIALEPEVLDALANYRMSLLQRVAAARKESNNGR